MSDTNTSNYSETREQKSDNNKVILIILIALLFLLLGAAGFLGYKFVDNSKIIKEQKVVTEKLTQENTELNTEIADLRKKYEGLKSENEQLNALAEERLARIEELEKRLRSGSGGGGGGGGLGSKGRKELEALKKEYAELKARYDRLAAENASLKDANSKLNQELTTTKQVNEQLQSTNAVLQEKVDLASIVTAGDVKAYGVSVKKGNEKVTDKSKKANKLEACFKIMQNNIAEPGDKEVYMVVKDPGGKVLSPGDANKFEYMGSEMNFSSRKSFYYSNKAQDICLEYTHKSALSKGTYKVEVYMDGTLIGKSNFDLK